jgi:hypothetical protein
MMEEHALARAELNWGSAKVYPASDDPGRWIVEPPREAEAGEHRSFTGPRANYMALEFAYEVYGKARFFALSR